MCPYLGDGEIAERARHCQAGIIWFQCAGESFADLAHARRFAVVSILGVPNTKSRFWSKKNLELKYEF